LFCDPRNRCSEGLLVALDFNGYFHDCVSSHLPDVGPAGLVLRGLRILIVTRFF
jgi:hypothetical protein